MFGLVRSSRRWAALVCVFALQSGCFAAQTAAAGSAMPRIEQHDGRYALFVNGRPYLMLAAQINNSSAWPAMLPEVWPAIEAIHANTVEMPIYWEQFEPQQGHFNDSVLLTLLHQAREHKVHLVLLWFGTWKNGSPHYTPSWIKLDNARYPRMVCSNGQEVDSLSPLSQATLDADKTAFSALMRELKSADPQHTVIMVQVENETGTWGCVRDFSPEANRLFAGAVPAALVKGLHKQPGTWTQVFGEDAPVAFHAWNVARYVGKVAAAGKAVYPLPMYANAALKPIGDAKPGTYESGGPTDNVLGIWKVAAPALNVLAPDIYDPRYSDYMDYLKYYGRADNPLMVPETGNASAYARYFFAVLGQGGMGFSPFGIDFTEYRNEPLGARRLTAKDLTPFALDYAIAGPMDRELARLSYEGKLKGVAESSAVHTQTLDFGAWRAVVSYGKPQFGFGPPAKGNPEPDGGALIGELGPNEFLVSAIHARVDFEPVEAGKQRQFVQVDQGYYKDGVWHFERIWNGDQTDYGLNFTSAPQVLRVTLATY